MSPFLGDIVAGVDVTIGDIVAGFGDNVAVFGDIVAGVDVTLDEARPGPQFHYQLLGAYAIFSYLAIYGPSGRLQFAHVQVIKSVSYTQNCEKNKT